MSETFTRDTPEGCTVTVRIHPGARKNAIQGLHDGALKISLTTPPVDGRANDALIAFLSDRLRIPKARITLLTGATSRSKTLRVATLTAPEVEAALLTDLA
ncbi:MAG: protein yggU [Acidobacteriaceae bacterium]|nr:protein yggU [Acidobacteriaceae bacterium]